MNRLFLLTLSSMVLLCSSDIRATRIFQNFDNDWYFQLGDLHTPDWNVQPSQIIQLPHDWSTGFDFSSAGNPESGYLSGGIGWYKKSFFIPNTWKGQCINIIFDGIYHKATIFLNGKQIGFHRYGYTSFETELTPYLYYGKNNIITVRVDNSELSRWYTGSGIYRHVWLQVTNPLHVKTWGTYITTPIVTEQTADVNVVTTIANYYPKPCRVEISQKLLGDNVGKIRENNVAYETKTIPPNQILDIKQSFKISSPELWDIDNPHIYKLETIIKQKGKVVDKYVTKFGIRSISFDKDKGFALNGRQIKLKGVCLHQDAGCLGVAVPDNAVEKRLCILKEFGVNAVRCSHNPPSSEFLNYCDSLGIMVIDEAFDKWKSGYYKDYFDTCWQQDISDMIIRDRNHPSIILWSIGNEVSEAGMAGNEGIERAHMLQDFVHQLEPSRKVMLALQPHYKDKFACVTDVVGYNYGELSFINDKQKHPERIGLISESFPYYSGLRPYEARDYSESNPWNYVMENEYICGAFVWAGIDYWGESMGWPSKGWSAGLFDMCMDAKPSASYFRAIWNERPYLRIAVVDYSLDEDPGKDHWQSPPMVHDWTFRYNDSRVLPIYAFTNCDSVLLKDSRGKLYGPRNPKDYKNNTIIWNQPYRPGKIVAIGYCKGQKVCSDSIETSENQATTYSLYSDRNELNANSQDLAFINLQLYDKNGVPVRIDDRLVTVSVEGAQGRLLGINSGEMRRNYPLNSCQLSTYRGKCQIIIQSGRDKGVINIKISVAGLGEQILKFRSK